MSAAEVLTPPAAPQLPSLQDARWRRFSVLTVPGWHNSGPAHWQSRWENLRPDIRRVEQDDWERPDPGSWILQLDKAINAARQPVILLAHSLGCITLAHWVKETGGRGVAAALLVAPPDVEREDLRGMLPAWSPVLLNPLPFKTLVLASSDDPYCSQARAQTFAIAWGADFIGTGKGGHLNAESGLGDWPAAFDQLQRLQGLNRPAANFSVGVAA